MDRLVTFRVKRLRFGLPALLLAVALASVGMAPVARQQRIRLDRGHPDKVTGRPFDNPNAAVAHVHGCGPDGITQVTVDGDPHIPTTGE